MNKALLTKSRIVLSSDLEEMADVVEHHQLLLKIEKAFPECDEERCLKIYENVLRCVGNKRYVSGAFRRILSGVEVYFDLFAVNDFSPSLKGNRQ